MSEPQVKEDWSWKKLFLGVFEGRNYGKALVLGLCLTIMATIGFSTYSFLKSKFYKPLPTIGTNSGTVNNTQTDKRSWSLFNLFNF